MKAEGENFYGEASDAINGEPVLQEMLGQFSADESIELAPIERGEFPAEISTQEAKTLEEGIKASSELEQFYIAQVEAVESGEQPTLLDLELIELMQAVKASVGSVEENPDAKQNVNSISTSADAINYAKEPGLWEKVSGGARKFFNVAISTTMLAAAMPAVAAHGHDLPDRGTQRAEQMHRQGAEQTRQRAGQRAQMDAQTRQQSHQQRMQQDAQMQQQRAQQEAQMRQQADQQRMQQEDQRQQQRAQYETQMRQQARQQRAQERHQMIQYSIQRGVQEMQNEFQARVQIGQIKASCDQNVQSIEENMQYQFRDMQIQSGINLSGIDLLGPNAYHDFQNLNSHLTERQNNSVLRQAQRIALQAENSINRTVAQCNDQMQRVYQHSVYQRTNSLYNDVRVIFR